MKFMPVKICFIALTAMNLLTVFIFLIHLCALTVVTVIMPSSLSFATKALTPTKHTIATTSSIAIILEIAHTATTVQEITYLDVLI